MKVFVDIRISAKKRKGLQDNVVNIERDMGYLD